MNPGDNGGILDEDINGLLELAISQAKQPEQSPLSSIALLVKAH